MGRGVQAHLGLVIDGAGRAAEQLEEGAHLIDSTNPVRADLRMLRVLVCVLLCAAILDAAAGAAVSHAFTGVPHTMNLSHASCTGSGSASCPSNSSLPLVFSHHHGTEHCICPADHICRGSRCSIGTANNSIEYTHMRFGFHPDCTDCSCEAEVPGQLLPRDAGVLWIIGTHHKMGSFLNQDVWMGVRKLVSPALRLHVNSYFPMHESDWRDLPHNKDVVVTFHAENITQRLVGITGRHYRFVHFVRDPAEAIVSAYLYETQRLDRGDRYNRLVKAADTDEDALSAILNYTMIHAVRPMLSQFVASETDHDALNIHYEDVLRDYKAPMTRAEYLAFQRGINKTEVYDGGAG